MRSTMVSSIVLGFCLLLPVPAFSAQGFGIFFDGWTDFNSNGRIDCNETVIYRVALFQDDAPPVPETGTITVPFDVPVRWRYLPGSFAPDFILLDSCTWSVLDGTDPGDPALVLSYSCDPHAGNPLDNNYAFQFRISGDYLGGSPGPVIVDAQNDRTAPTAGSQHSVDSIAGPLTPCAPPPDLRLTKTVLSGDGAPGSTLVYELTVTNFGNVNASNVVFQETVPLLTTFSAAGSSPGWSCAPNGNAGSSCTLNIGSLGVGASATRTFAVQVASSLPPGSPTIDNTACVSSTPPDDPLGNNCASTSTPAGNPDLTTVKSIASGNGNPGSTLVYNLIVTNTGNRTAAGVQLADTVPALATFLPASSSPGWSCAPNNNAGSTCTLAVGTLAAGASATRTFAVQLASTFPSNPPAIDNTACSSTTTGGDPAANNCGSVSTPPGGNPDLRTSKSVASGSGNPGLTLVYSLIVANIGSRDAAGVQVTETVPALSTFLSAGSSPGWSCTPSNNAGSTCTLSLGTVAAGTSATRTFAVQLASTFPSNPPSIDNTACSSTTTAGDPAGNNCGSVSTPPGGNPDLRTSKSVETGNGSPGSVLVYSLTVANGGTRAAEGVQLTDTVPALSTFLPESSSPGWTCSPSNNAGSNCTLVLGTLAAGASATRTFAVQLASTFPSNPPVIDNTACASTTTAGDPAADNCGTVSTPPGGNPDVSMTKSVASGNGSPGGVLVYELVVTNGGNRDAASVVLEETVPQLTTFLPVSSSPGWSCTPNGSAGSACALAVGTVAAGGSASFTFAVQVASTFPVDPPPIANSACVTTTSGGDPSANDCGTTSTPPGGNPDVRMTKSVASGSADPGSLLIYQLDVANIGTQDAEGVSLEETVPQLTTFLPASSSPGWNCTPNSGSGSACTLAVGTVAAGGSASFTFAVQVASTFPADPPPIANSACITTTSGGDPSGNDCGTTTTPPGGNPDVRMSKSVASGSATPGSVLVYQLEVANIGTQDAAGVAIEETVPQLTTFLTASSSPGWACTPDNNAGSSCTLALGTVAAGSSASFTFAVQVASTFPADPPPIANSACVTTTSGGDLSGNDCGSTSTPPGGSPDLRLVKSVESGSANPGSVLVYSLEVSNVGTRDAADVTVEETVPQLTTFLPASSSPGWTCTPDNTGGSSCTLALGTVAAGSSATYTFAVEVANTFPPNPPPIENSACVSTTSGGDPEGNDCGSTSTPPGGSPDLRLLKSVTPGSANPGAVLVYALEISNVGTQDAANVRLEETVPQLTTFLPANSSPGWTCTPDNSAGSSCTLPVGTVAAVSSVTFSFAVRVAATLPPDVEIENSACVSTPSGGGPQGDDCGSTSTPPGGGPDLVLSKSLASGTVVPSGVLVFTLSLHNQGDAEAAGVVLQETVPQDSSFEAASSSPGWSCTPGASAGSECTLAVGTVGAGVSQSFSFAVRLRSDLPAGTQVSNAACVEQDSGANDPSGNDCSTVVVDPPGPETRTDVELSLAVDDAHLPPGVPFLFTLTLRNRSTVAAEGLRISVALPSFGTEPTELDPACKSPDGTVIECSFSQLAANATVQLTWKHAAFQVGDYGVSAELMTAMPEDVDSTPGNGVETEDDFAQVAVSVSNDPAVHDIPTLSTVGISVMILLLVGLAVVFLRRGNIRSAA